MRLRSIVTTFLLSAFTIIMITRQTEAATSRRDWLVQQIYHYNHPLAANLPNELVVKMHKMSQNAFLFYRGTAHLFYEDTKHTPPSRYTNDITNRVWLQGDLHLQNMGGFRDAKDNAVFDCNDFDEGYWGAYTWELRRMAVSVLLVADENGISYEDGKKLVAKLVESYAEQMTVFNNKSSESDFQLDINNTNGVVKKIIRKADDKKRSEQLKKYTEVTEGKRSFKLIGEPSKPCIESFCLQPVDNKTLAAIAEAMPAYINSISASKRKKDSYYQLKDAALRLGSGIGSLGRYRYYLLIDGASNSLDDDVILEMKQEISSSVAIAAPDNMPATYYNNHEGERVAKTMKAMLINTDPLVGYTTMNKLAFFIRQRSPYQEDFDYTLLTDYDKFKDTVVSMGKIIAKSHALADKNYDDRLIKQSMDKEIVKVINDDISGLKAETLNYALDYAAQVKQDYADFKTALTSGATLY